MIVTFFCGVKYLFCFAITVYLICYYYHICILSACKGLLIYIIIKMDKCVIFW